MAPEHRHTTGKPGTGEDIETRRPRTDPYLAADVADVAAAETGKTAEAEVGVGEMVQPTPSPPTKTDRNFGAEVRTEEKEVGQRRRDYGVMGMGSYVRPAVRRPQEKLGPAIGSQQRRQYIDLEEEYLREASRQAPAGEGAASHQAPKDERETSVGPSIRRPQEKVRPDVRRPQDIVRPAIAALTVRSAIGTHKCRLPLWRSQ